LKIAGFKGDKLTLLLVLAGVVVIVGGYALLVLPAQSKLHTISVELRSLLEEEAQYINVRRYPQGPPSQEVLKQIEEVNNILRTQYEEAVKKLDLVKDNPVEDTDVPPKNIWFAKVDEVLKDVRNKAMRTGVELDKDAFSFFTEKNPTDEEVPDLIMELELAHTLALLAFDAGLDKVGKLEFYSEMEEGPRTGYLRTIRCLMPVVGRADNIIKFIYMLQNAEECCVLKDLSLNLLSKQLGGVGGEGLQLSAGGFMEAEFVVEAYYTFKQGDSYVAEKADSAK